MSKYKTMPMTWSQVHKACHHANISLRSGVWVTENGQLWSHWRASNDLEHIGITKGGHGRNRLANKLKLLRMLPRVKMSIVDKRCSEVPGPRRFSADTVVLPSDGGLIFFDEERGGLVRYYGFGKITPHQEAQRRVWAEFVNAPDFGVSGDRRFIEEQMVNGKHICDLNYFDLIPVLNNIQTDYTALACHLKVKDPSVSIAIDLNEALGRDFLASVEDDFFISFFDELLNIRNIISTIYVPTGSDNSPNNVVITESSYQFIDTFPILQKAVFSHPLGVIAAWSVHNNDVLMGFINGRFDEFFVPLLEVSGLNMCLTKRRRFAILLLAIALPGKTTGIRSNPGPELAKTPVEMFNWLSRAYKLHELRAVF